jgi:hypothetical protein
MKTTRRQFIARLAGAAGAVGFLIGNPNQARACLYGTWRVKCPSCGRIDTVTDGTCQHKCSNGGTQVFSGDDVTVVCPNNHEWHITTVHPATDSYVCKTCGKDCNTGPHIPNNSGQGRGGGRG